MARGIPVLSTSNMLIMTIVIHISALNSLNELGDYVFTLLEKYTEAERLEYLNSRNAEGFSALHLCAFRGNMVCPNYSVY